MSIPTVTLPNQAVLCEGSFCPLKSRCSRYLDHRAGNPGKLFTGIPFRRSSCDHFMPVEARSRDHGAADTRAPSEPALA